MNNNATPKLSLAIQYACDVPELSRSKIRSWVQKALNAAYKDMADHDSKYIPKPEYTLAAVEITIRFVDESEGKELNLNYRNRDYATNVLTFEYGMTPDGTASGDIVLCVPVIRLQADEQDKDFLHHAAHLIIHGVLHALGYDHTENEQAQHMEHIETTILAKMSITDPYLAR